MKRADIKRRPMADTVLAALEPEPVEYREHDDGQGLYFRVKKDGKKSWQLRYKDASGKWQWHGLGSYPELTGTKAREQAAEKRKGINAGVYPADIKRAAKIARESSTLNPFRESVAYWYRRKVEDGLAESTLRLMRGYIENDILPALGDRPISEITPKECAALQESIEARGATNTRDKIRVALRQIFSQAIARGLCEVNPASELVTIATKTPLARPYPHLLEPELPAFLKAMRLSTSRTPAKIATWMCLWTASRPGMVRWAEWSEFDLETALWTIPAAKMKTRIDHVVPLSRQAVGALMDLHRLTGRGRYLFPGIGAKNPVISENTINLTLRKIGYKDRLVGHGTRHTASTLLREHGWEKDHVEAQLAHIEPSVSGTYNKAKYLAQRRAMMQWYGDYLECLENDMTPEQRAKFAGCVNSSNV
ncbi:MAG TPA: tyrosine-type recombinase/integrase [Pseudomonas sp.]|nr:tyrosine-type recombinase/integrase [Pseudomonas sp.]